jgi:hypothetical protein
MCGMLAPADAPPMDALAAFAKWTSTHYGDLANQCYYSTSCLSDVTQKEQWYNQKTWVWQCCSQLAYWQVRTQRLFTSASNLTCSCCRLRTLAPCAPPPSLWITSKTSATWRSAAK